MSELDELPEVPPETLAHFEAERLGIVNLVVERSLKRRDEVAQHGEMAGQRLTMGLDFTTRALGIAMQLRNAELRRQQVVWGNDRLPHDSVEPQHILVRFHILGDVVRETLPLADAAIVNQYVDYLIGLQDAYVNPPVHAS